MRKLGAWQHFGSAAFERKQERGASRARQHCAAAAAARADEYTHGRRPVETRHAEAPGAWQHFGSAAFERKQERGASARGNTVQQPPPPAQTNTLTAAVRWKQACGSSGAWQHFGSAAFERKQERGASRTRQHCAAATAHADERPAPGRKVHAAGQAKDETNDARPREIPGPLPRQGRRSAGWSLRRSRRLIPSHLRSRNHVLLHQRRKKKRRKERTKESQPPRVGGSPPRLPSANWPRPASPRRGQFFYYDVARPRGKFPDVNATAREVILAERCPDRAPQVRVSLEQVVALVAAPRSKPARTPTAASPRPPQPPAQCIAPRPALQAAS